MSTQPDIKLISKSYVFFEHDGWLFRAWSSTDEREFSILDNMDYLRKVDKFNLWTGKYDDTYIAPPYIPDRGWINLSGKECEPIYWLNFHVYNVEIKKEDEDRYKNDLNYRNTIIQKTVEVWKHITNNIQFWYDLEKVTWNKNEERYFHVDQCWFCCNPYFPLDNNKPIAGRGSVVHLYD